MSYNVYSIKYSDRKNRVETHQARHAKLMQKIVFRIDTFVFYVCSQMHVFICLLGKHECFKVLKI